MAALLFAVAGMGARSSADEGAAATSEQVEFFETKIRPVLAESCIKCHGPKKQSSGLRLDSRDALLEGGLNGPSVVPGDPEQSLLVQAVRKTHDDIKMPPKETLQGPEVDALAAWVKMGAPWPKDLPKTTAANAAPAANQWALRPVDPGPMPSIQRSEWIRTPVDAFILARLEASGLSPSPEADRRTLIRRATFDLTGLPPTPEEVDAFLHDQRPDAYDQLIDRLLASPRYGERWGRHWLDVARYADTKGYVFNQERRYPYSYTYRDYVIRAFNEDKPYDRFVIEQIAADRVGLKDDDAPGELAALGFLTVGRRYLNNNEDIIDDRIDVVTRGLLGLTVACARCHDHKFDPIPTDDYYSLFGVFASSVEPADPPAIPGAVPPALTADFQAKVAEKQKAIDDFVAAKRVEVIGDLRARVALYLRASFDLGFSTRSMRGDPKLDERARADKLSPNRLRVFSSRWKDKLDATRTNHDPVFAHWHAFAALSAAEFAGKNAGDVAKALAVDRGNVSNAVVSASFAESPPASMAEVVARYGMLLAEADKKARDNKGAALDDPAWEALRLVLYAEDGPLTLPVEGFLKSRVLDRAESDKVTKLSNALANLKATHAGAPPRAMVMNDAASPVEPRVFLRGNPGRPGKTVPRQFLKLLSGPDRQPFRDGSGRLELARAIASKENPLTARVMVNRIWLNHFGTGLVTTPSDFGVRSEPPSHPELLDWLADDFVRQGWSIKSIHRRIMLSNTYRQQSENRSEALAKDPLNRLWWKFNRRRLEFEAIRDSLLAVSGALDTEMGGRSVPINDPPFPPRRTVYGYIDRLSLDVVYRTFDFASPDASSPRRLVTTVPQQALFLMNSPFVIEQSRRLASRIVQTRATHEERNSQRYQNLFGREPDTKERALGVAFIRRQEEAGPSLPPPAWSYGVGRLVSESPGSPLADFRPLPHWTGTSWQAGSMLPDPEAHFVHWNSSGGHPGHNDAHAAVLRWTAPRDAAITIEGSLGHASDRGDGVRGVIVSSLEGVIGDWVAHNGKVATTLARRDVKQGETIDFVVDCRQEDSFDTFNWAPLIRDVASRGQNWDAKVDFHGPAQPGLSPWEEYAQVLLLTNEFVFVD